MPLYRGDRQWCAEERSYRSENMCGNKTSISDEEPETSFHSPDIAAHKQRVTRSYYISYPAHPPRESDPHYVDFEAFRRRTQATAKCAVGEHRNDFTECVGGLELHHSHVEFSLQNGVDLAWLEKDYPGISDPSTVGAWVESAENLLWLCEFHHRGHGGVHCATSSDFEAERYVRGLIS